MNFALRSRFGRNGIYTDPRVLIPLVILVGIRLVSGAYTPERNVEAANMTILEQSLEKQRLVAPRSARTHRRGQRPVAPTPEAPPGTYEVQKINIDGTPAGWTPSPLMIAGVAGGGMALMGVAGALMILRRSEDDALQAELEAAPRPGPLVDEFYGDSEIQDLVNRMDRPGDRRSG